MTTIVTAHKIKLNPTTEQEHLMFQIAGATRWAWNWGLWQYNLRLEAKMRGDEGVKVSGRSLKTLFRKLKYINPGLAWTAIIPASSVDGVFDDLQAAFNRFWDRYKKGELKPPADWKGRKDGKMFGWPSRKTRQKSIPAFYQSNQSIKAQHFEGNFVRIPKVGWVNMSEPLRFEGKVLGSRVTYRQRRWWLSVQIEIPHETPKHNSEAVGIDFGIKYLWQTSEADEGEENPRILRKSLRKRRRLQRKLDRQRRANNPDNFDAKGRAKRRCSWTASNKQRQTEAKLANLDYRITCLRREKAHEFTSKTTDNYGLIGVETLNIKGMIKNRRLAKDIADAAWYEKRRQLEYKAARKGGLVVPIDQWFPSSKLCGGCKVYINTELTLAMREWVCPECGQVNERDKNAAINIRDEALRMLGEV